MAKTPPYGSGNLPPPPGYVPPAPGHEPPEKSPLKTILIGLVAVILIGVAGAAAWVVKGRSPSSAAAGESAAPGGEVEIVAAKVSAPVQDFGSPDATAPGLPGTFYDLIKDPSGKNSDLPHGIPGAKIFVESFLKGEMTAEALKTRFWAAPTTLRTGRFAFTSRPPKDVQDLFGVEDRKTHSYAWAIVYRGRVQAPFTGEFRFVGFGSDDIAVRFAGVPVLEAWHARFIPAPEPSHEEVFRFGKPKKDGTYVGDPVRAGVWIPVERGKIYDIEIALTHAQPYALSKFFLMYERKGEEHAADPEGYKTYTRFRVTDDPGSPVPEDPLALPPASIGPVFPVAP